jgi:haloalkane dehalogenase
MTLAAPGRQSGEVPVDAPVVPFPEAFRTVSVERGPHRIHAREQPGDEPAILLLHGYPDNHHLYDRLVGHLPGRHVVVFDFLGWGESDKPAAHRYTFENLTGDLDAVVKGLSLDRLVLVPHDASGPPAINWALDHPVQVAAIVALNTFYCDVPGSPLNPPEAIRLFSDPNFAWLTAHFAASPAQFRWLYDFQVGGFIQDDDVRQEFVPLLFRQFQDRPSSIGPFMQLNADLIPAVLAAAERTDELHGLAAPVRFAFGENDPYLSPAYGEALAALFPRAEAKPIAGAAHSPSSMHPPTSHGPSSAPPPDRDESVRDPAAGGRPCSSTP